VKHSDYMVSKHEFLGLLLIFTKIARIYQFRLNLVHGHIMLLCLPAEGIFIFAGMNMYPHETKFINSGNLRLFVLPGFYIVIVSWKFVRIFCSTNLVICLPSTLETKTKAYNLSGSIVQVKSYNCIFCLFFIFAGFRSFKIIVCEYITVWF
jgi:hypothetical protein